MNCNEEIHQKMMEAIKEGEPLEEFCECVRGCLERCIEQSREQLDYDATAADYKQWCLSLAEKERESLEIYNRFLAFEKKFCEKYGLKY